MALASVRGALLITGDEDFGELVYRLGRLSSGVLLTRLAGLSAARKADVVASAIDAHLERMSGSFSVLRPGSLRIRSAD